MIKIRKIHSVGAAIVVSLALFGCADGIEVNGKLVNALGITGSTKKGEPKVPVRAGLILPPSVAALPAPDSVAAPTQVALWPEDPDQKAERLRAEQEEEEARQKCIEIEEEDKLLAELKKNSPYEKGRRCGTLMGDMGKTLGKDEVPTGNVGQ